MNIKINNQEMTVQNFMQQLRNLQGFFNLLQIQLNNLETRVFTKIDELRKKVNDLETRIDKINNLSCRFDELKAITNLR